MSTQPQAQAETPKEEKKSIIVRLSYERKGGKNFLSYEIPKAIEEKYKEISRGEIGKSSNWNGLEFYRGGALKGSAHYVKLLRKYGFIDSFGGNSSADSFNVAVFRTVGGRGTIEIGEYISIAEGEMLLSQIVQFLKEVLEYFFAERKVSASITIEI